MATETETPLLDQIAEQRQVVVETQETADRAVRRETRRLAELLAATRDVEDRDVNIASAARRIGVTKGYAHSLVQRLDAGDL